MEKYNNLSITKVISGEVIIHSCMSPEEGEMVCSIIVETKNNLVVVDVPLLKPFAKDFRTYIDKISKPLDRVIITHSHPDHWFGLEYFKDIPVYALAETIKEIDEYGESYIKFHHTMEGDLVTNEKVVPSNEIKDFEFNIDGLNYKLLKILNAEATVMLAVELTDISALIAQDLIYNKVFLYNGEKSANGELLHDSWIENLKSLSKNNYKIVIPGHGEPTDSSIFGKVIEYIETEKKALESSKNGDELKKIMLEKYPEYRNPKMLDISNAFLFAQK